ncbi:MAG: hypothetical protein IT494_00315 [Gammaproteobacteria bacterium]|nr:hypothetical protein [Gammaproteobacteria bacterium]
MASGTALIELRLQSIGRLYNSLDPSPFHERDLDRDAEQFIVSWAQEYPLRQPLRLRIHFDRPPEPAGEIERIADSVHHFFAYRSTLNRLDLRRLVYEGWISRVIGLLFLTSCILIAHTLVRGGSVVSLVLREGLTLVGWVAMWRPLDICLYRWWPIRRLGRIYDKLASVPIEIHPGR